MKKLSSLFILLATLVITGTGCLKDESFDNQDYGIQVTETKAVAFPQAPKSPVTVGITGQSAPLTISGPFITIEGPAAANSNVTVTLAFDDALVTSKGLTPLPAGSYSLNTMNATIASGAKFTEELKITILKSDLLDPNTKYGIGIKITGADQGYAVPENLSTVIIGLAIKNKYDGVYTLKGYHNRTPYTFPYETTIHLITNGPNEVYFYWPDAKLNAHPIGISATSMSYYGAMEPSIIFDPTTDLVASVYNMDASGAVITMFTGAGSRVSKFDPATRAITVDWNYNGNPLRAFFDDLTYVGPRP